MSNLYVYVPGDAGLEVATSSREEILAEHPNALVFTGEECRAAMAAADDKKYLEITKEITEDRYWELLEVLPPIGYDGRTFRMGSPIADGVFIYCTAIRERFFQSTRRSCPTASEEFLKECRELIAS